MINNLLITKPPHEIHEHLYHAAIIGKGCVLQDRQILHKAVVDDILHNLVYKANRLLVLSDKFDSLPRYLYPHAEVRKAAYFGVTAPIDIDPNKSLRKSL